MEADEFKGRKAPYAPVSALEEFFNKMRNVAVPARVDQRFLQKLSIAAGNEWALLSALKFLGVIDSQGRPTHAYRLLQSSDRFQDTLRHLVQTAYEPVFNAGGLAMSQDDLVNFFRVTSSPSQQRNAARFFRAVCRMAGIEEEGETAGQPLKPAALTPSPAPVSPVLPRFGAEAQAVSIDAETRAIVLRAKARLLEKLPAPREDWSATEYESICERFLEMLRHLE